MATIIRFRLAEAQPDQAVGTAMDASLSQSLSILPPSVLCVGPLRHRGQAMPP
jgi:hypothetical protein